jgi:hypothetical protein
MRSIAIVVLAVALLAAAVAFGVRAGRPAPPPAPAPATRRPLAPATAAPTPAAPSADAPVRPAPPPAPPRIDAPPRHSKEKPARDVVDLRGVVLDAQSGAAVAGAQLRRDGELLATTGADGGFVLPDVAPGPEIRLAVKHPRYRGKRVEGIVLEAGRDPEPLEIRLEPLAGAAFLDVFCHDDRGAPLAGARVSLDDSAGLTFAIAADAGGRASLEVAAGSYAVAAGKDDEGGVVYQDAEPVAISLADGERKSVDLALTRMAKLVGTVVGARVGLKIEVILPAREVAPGKIVGGSRSIGSLTVDEEGRFEASFEPGPREVRVIAATGTSALAALQLEPGAVVEATFAIDASAQVVVRGVVRAAPGGEPIAGASVAAWTSTVATDPRGAFELRGTELPRDLTVAAPGFAQRQIPIAEDAKAPVELAVELEPAGSLRVTVLTPSGEPAAGVSVWIDRPGAKIFQDTDEAGVCVAADLAPDKYEVRLGRKTEPAATVVVKAGEEAHVSLTSDAAEKASK